jgi:hypothetical protein
MPSAVLTHRMPGTADRTDGHLPHSCYDRRSLAPHVCRTCVTIGGPERRTSAGVYCRTCEVGHYASAGGKYLQYDPTAGENCRHTPGTARHLCEIWSALRAGHKLGAAGGSSKLMVGSPEYFRCSILAKVEAVDDVSSLSAHWDLPID